MARQVVDEAIEGLNLRTSAKQAAYILKGKHPDIVFTSGRRDVEQQAHAMATNVVKNRLWIGQTYKANVVGKACQRWVDVHSGATLNEIAEGLRIVLGAFSDDQRKMLSRHFSGDAWDVEPVEQDAEQIKANIRALPSLDEFLEREGGFVRWHAQFNEVSE